MSFLETCLRPWSLARTISFRLSRSRGNTCAMSCSNNNFLQRGGFCSHSGHCSSAWLGTYSPNRESFEANFCFQVLDELSMFIIFQVRYLVVKTTVSLPSNDSENKLAECMRELKKAKDKTKVWWAIFKWLKPKIGTFEPKVTGWSWCYQKPYLWFRNKEKRWTKFLLLLLGMSRSLSRFSQTFDFCRLKKRWVLSQFCQSLLIAGSIDGCHRELGVMVAPGILVALYLNDARTFAAKYFALSFWEWIKCFGVGHQGGAQSTDVATAFSRNRRKEAR